MLAEALLACPVKIYGACFERLLQGLEYIKGK